MALKDNRLKTPEQVMEALKDPNLTPERRRYLAKRRQELLKKQQQKEQAKNNPRLERQRAKSDLAKKRAMLGANSKQLVKKLAFNERTEKLIRKAKSGPLESYIGRLAHRISKGWGESEVPLEDVPKNHFLLTSNKILTNNSVRMPIVITEWGRELPIGWLDGIRETLTQLEGNYNEQMHTNLRVFLNETQECEASNISFNGDKALQNAYTNYLRSTNTRFSKDDYNLQTFDWLQDMDTNGDSLWSVRVFLDLIVSGGRSGETAELLRQAYEVLEREMNALRLKTKDMYLTVQQYFDEFSPLGHNFTNRGNFSALHKRFPAAMRSGQMILSTTDLQEGNISDLMGVPVGIDIFSGRPIFIDYSDNHSASVSTMISATTGAGKTFLVQSIITSMLLFDDKYFPIVLDFKGEYVELGKSVGMQIISSSPSSGVYYDTMDLGECTGDREIDAEKLDSAISTTESVFAILLGANWSRLKPAFQFVQRQLYKRVGVYFDRPKTWKNSRGLTYHTLYNEINKVLSQNRAQATDEADINDFKKLQQELSAYFEPDGPHADYFRHPLRMEDINDGRGIIFDLAQNAGGSGSSNDTRLQLIMVFILHIIRNLTHRVRNKRLLPIFWEETNQLLLIPRVAQMMSKLTTGGRSAGIRNFFITNSPGQVFSTAAKDVKVDEHNTIDSGVVKALMANVNTAIIGANNTSDMQALSDHFKLNSSTQQVFLEALAEQTVNGNGDRTALAHKFILLHKKNTALIQAVSNQTLIENGVFGTETDINKINDEQELKDELMQKLLNNDNTNADTIRLNSTRSEIMKGLDAQEQAPTLQRLQKKQQANRKEAMQEQAQQQNNSTLNFNYDEPSSNGIDGSHNANNSGLNSGANGIGNNSSGNIGSNSYPSPQSQSNGFGNDVNNSFNSGAEMNNNSSNTGFNQTPVSHSSGNGLTPSGNGDSIPSTNNRNNDSLGGLN